MKRWLAGWYVSPSIPLDVLEARMRETVTLASEAGEGEVQAADEAFNAFIVAANLLNDLNATVGGAVETAVHDAAIPRARRAARHLAAAARALESVAPRGTEEPTVPADPKFSDER